MGESAIFAKGLIKRFNSRRGGITAIDHLSLDVSPGETYGLIGPDGAGKTTTIRVLLGLLTRTQGESSILGLDSMRDTYQIRERIGYIAQQFVLPADLTVMENMLFFAKIQGVEPDQQKKRIQELLAFAGLTDFTARLAGQLSGGMKKKLALACSLIHEPEVVLLDEPTLGVDPVSRREFWNLLGNLRVEKGMTVFVCTPYMDEAERCVRVGLMYAGKLIANDTPVNIKKGLTSELLELTPSDFVSAKTLVPCLAGVRELQTYGDKLHVFVDRASQRKPEIAAALAAQGIGHDEIRRIEPRMEEAFISLIRQQTQANSEGQAAAKPESK
ncbi:MAG TPA: ABC transporter ATP-binding protein [Anaerolineales bacterium]|nr:ABC transporter ATP-binding protein [Anaerolineales bacterium]